MKTVETGSLILRVPTLDDLGGEGNVYYFN